MYVTRPLSLYFRSPDLVFARPPEGPNSGYLVVEDEESAGTMCFGLCKSHDLQGLPLPQNKRIDVVRGSGKHTSYYPVFFIPVINQALSSNLYYAIKARGRHKGEAYASSKEEDKVTCCFCYIRDEKPRPLVPTDIYQQFQISHATTCGNSYFSAKSVAADGYPPRFLRSRAPGWGVRTSTPKRFTLGEASGLDSSLRGRLPDSNFPPSREYSEVQVVGKWYTPFMFVKEGTPKEQMKRAMFYEVTLEQRWERIFTSERGYNEGNAVAMDVVAPTQVVTVAGMVAVEEEKHDADGVHWFKSTGDSGVETRVGLSSLVLERMMWEQERVGWVNSKEKQARVSRVHEYGGIGSWRKFGCYLLVEKFAIKRVDGSLLLAYEFKHIHQILVKWE
ncbi:hypothetical protein Nepgr_029388 [Nepenthes gracilis]|uniref:Uncharacterized protein n=1 Tax=Nepenthes gracilis TaxID=150966 RepID=A0AAD3TCD9_NEPGR|nr:hypothetical protein Nepgr_029388 [Nepenthes gracilis]